MTDADRTAAEWPATQADIADLGHTAAAADAAIEARITALTEAVARMAAYLGVTHVLKDPRV